MSPEWIERLLPSADTIEAEGLRAEARKRGAVPIAAAPIGSMVRVSGTVRSIVLRPSTSVQMLEVTIFDGATSLTVIWMGRHRMLGIGPGRGITVEGRVVRAGDEYRMYNPRYELHPRAGGE